MKSRVRVHPAAADELDSAADWYEEILTGLGSEFRHLALETGKFPLLRVMAGLQSSYTHGFTRRH
ncbi:MAG: hypothetical protein ACRD1B_12100, partial [Thermoanaerobaculia bacterium]